MSVAQSSGKQFGLLGSSGATDLGEEIQNVAARRFLPRVDHRIDREGMHQFGSATTGKVWVIASGDYLRRPENWPPSQYIRPLWIAMHIAPIRGERSGLAPQETMLTHPAVKCLKGYGPVGARDAHTLDLLRNAGVESYLSGCLTLTLERPSVAREDDLIVLNDVPEQVSELIRQQTSKRVLEASHVDPTGDGEARLARAEELLQLYARAGCVITTRLHCALPCLAFGTPVLLLDSAANRLVLSGLHDFLHHCSVDELFAGRAGFDVMSPPPNPDRHPPCTEALRARVAEFVALPEAADPYPQPLSLSDRYTIIAANQSKALRFPRQAKAYPAIPVSPVRRKTVLLQTSDAHVYAPMLQETARINKVYCARHGLEYQCFIGIKRGYHSWQATFNRIQLLLELQQAGDIGWVIYLDADAYVYDLDFDVHAYLADKRDHVCIAASGGTEKWAVNAGVLFVNLQHPLGRRLVQCWATAFAAALSDQDLLASAGPWSAREDDQGLLQRVLHDNQDILDATLIEKGLLNYAKGSFIRQALRCAGNSMPLRLQRAALDIRAALSRIPAGNPVRAAFVANHDAAGKRLYAFLFEQLRDQFCSLLHIGPLATVAGVDEAEIPELEAANFASVHAWLDYLPHAHCFDVNAFSPDDEESRISFVRADLSHRDGWREIAKQVPPLGIAIDTAVLGPEHQARAFLALFRRLQSGGHYVIEGLADSARGRERVSRPGGSTADLFLGYLTGGTLAIAGAEPYEIDECVRRIGQVYIDRSTNGGSESGAVQRVVVVAKN